MLRLILNASMKLRTVTTRAGNFKYKGIVIRGMVVGGVRLEMINPAKINPINRRLMELTKRGLFSLIGAEGEKREKWKTAYGLFGQWHHWRSSGAFHVLSW